MNNINIFFLIIGLFFNCIFLYFNIRTLFIIKKQNSNNKQIEQNLEKRENQCNTFFQEANKLYAEARTLQVKHRNQQLELNQQISQLTIQRDQLIQTIEKEKTQINNIYQHEKDRINKDLEDYKHNYKQCCEQYGDTLEQAYQQAEQQYNLKIAQAEEYYQNKISKINLQIAQYKNELEELKRTRAATQEAFRKEAVIKSDRLNYALIPEKTDINDITKLEQVKKELTKPRILSMLIWKTYYLPIAQKKFVNILGPTSVCGIYKITNQKTNECYIGQSCDIYRRWCEHVKCGLGIDTPAGNKLYKAMNEYGISNFTFELLQKCDKEQLNDQEQYFISLYEANIYGYNGRNQK